MIRDVSIRLAINMSNLLPDDVLARSLNLLIVDNGDRGTGGAPRGRQACQPTRCGETGPLGRGETGSRERDERSETGRYYTDDAGTSSHTITVEIVRMESQLSKADTGYLFLRETATNAVIFVWT